MIKCGTVLETGWPTAKLQTLTSILPGVIVIGGVLLVRFLGALQSLEWASLDYGLRFRPPEALDERILIVGINEGDIQALQSYPISDQALAGLLTQLQIHQPRAIGIDLFRDLPVEPGHDVLIQRFQTMPNLVGIERILPDSSGFTISPPTALPPQQVGFVDAILDSDGFLRRSLLGAYPSTRFDDAYRFSFTIRLTELYLQSQGIELSNGVRDPDAMRFESQELHRVTPNIGGYIRTNASGNQILLNFRSGPTPFRQVSMREILAGTVNPDWIEDRIVLVGLTASSQKDLINTAAITGINPGLVSGVEIQAHAISQIISAVLDERALLSAWSEGWEFLWIIVWGSVGILLGRLTRSPLRHFSIVAILGMGLIGGSYLGLVVGIWIPVVPALLAFGINSIGLYSFYLYDQGLKARIRDRQRVIENTFDAIHNGPLQRLAELRRQVKEQGDPLKGFGHNLQALNHELREVYETMRQETLAQGQQLLLNPQMMLNVKAPLHEILYEMYITTLEREFPYFSSLKVKVVTFDPMADQALNLEQKRDLCRFLEEALCNVGKYAVGATRLTVICGQESDRNVIRVQDNGLGQSPSDSHSFQQGGRGSQQAKDLARRLRGKFNRRTVQPKGMICELVWPIRQPALWARWHR